MPAYFSRIEMTPISLVKAEGELPQHLKACATARVDLA
jgi:hypothetical protein